MLHLLLCTCFSECCSGGCAYVCVYRYPCGDRSILTRTLWVCALVGLAVIDGRVIEEDHVHVIISGEVSMIDDCPSPAAGGEEDWRGHVSTVVGPGNFWNDCAGAEDSFAPSRQFISIAAVTRCLAVPRPAFFSSLSDSPNLLHKNRIIRGASASRSRPPLFHAGVHFAAMC
eukprot:GHVU01217111.1.p3 GENE.GHVU01217111.1~~GHVU01217111.1.p3  ORF type:complete len:172 (+),score=14.76 GHVU01217111.1:186-701(+)